MGLFNRHKDEQKENTESKEEVKFDRYDSNAEVNQRREGESTQDYNERVPIAFQPMAPANNFDYLGRKKD